MHFAQVLIRPTLSGQMVDQGASIVANYIDFQTYFAFARQNRLTADENQSMLQTFSSTSCGEDWPGQDWFLSKVRAKQNFIVLNRSLGLSHPQLPFAVSARAVLLEDRDDVQNVLDVARLMGLEIIPGFYGIGQVSFPYTFPRALTSGDWKLQRAHCMLALGRPGAAALVEASTSTFAEELLGASASELADLSAVGL